MRKFKVIHFSPHSIMNRGVDIKMGVILNADFFTSSEEAESLVSRGYLEEVTGSSEEVSKPPAPVAPVIENKQEAKTKRGGKK